VLRLRADVPGEDCPDLLADLAGIGGVRRITSTREATNGNRVIAADVAIGDADAVLDAVHRAGLHGEEYVLVREDPVVRRVPDRLTDEDFSWVEVVGEARANARPVARYVVMMMVAGWIAGLGVIANSQILIIGAMAVSPDLLPLCATCVGAASRRFDLARRALITLVIGMMLVMAVALAVAAGLRAAGLLSSDITLHQGVIAALAQTDYSTVMIALAAGVAAILSFETRAATAVGVAISVTTVPASAYFGVSLAFGETAAARGALAVLAVNLSCLIIAGTITLLLQRRFAPRH